MVLLGLLTVIQAGTALWRIGVMFQEGLKFGPTRFALTPGFFEEIVLSLAIAFTAWWWLPRGDRTGPAWSVRFLVLAWSLALGQLAWVLATGSLRHGVTWALLAGLFLLGIWARGPSPIVPHEPISDTTEARHPALYGALLFWLLQLPHLFFPYHWTDTKDIWACRTVAFEHRGDLSGIFDCLDPGRPPLHSLLLWLGHTNGTLEGRLLPFLMVGAFGLVMHHLLRKVAPRLAPWGLLWFFMTVRVYQGSVSNYADVATMIAITVAVVVAVDPELIGSRWIAVAFAMVAGMAAALIKRDGGALLFVATAVLVWRAPRRLDPRLYGAAVGAALGFFIWIARPNELYVPDVYAPVSIGAERVPVRAVSLLPPGFSTPGIRPAPVTSDSAVVDSTRATFHTYVTMFYGMQGQVLSHYGYCMFVPGWIILGFWVRRRRLHLPPLGRLWGWIGVLGWLAIVGIYIVHVSTGHPYRGSLFVIRTAFGRHLLHMFAFALLNAVALAEVLTHSTPPNRPASE